MINEELWPINFEELNLDTEINMIEIQMLKFHKK